MRHDAWLPAVFPIVFALLGAGGCQQAALEAACLPENIIHGVCAGVPPAPVCDEGSCTTGVDCASTIPVGDDAGLTSAAASASPGACIVLSPGAYGPVSLPGGVSLLGKSADDVMVQGVVMGAGNGAVVRGLAVGSGGLRLAGATGARVESVRVAGSANAGVELEEGASATIVTSAVEDSERYGIHSVDSTTLTLDRVVVSGSQGPAIWTECVAGCACALEAIPWVDAGTSIVRDNHLTGVALFGASAKLTDVDILRTLPGDHWHTLEGGQGLSVASCSSLQAEGLRVQDNISYGVLVDHSAATLGSEATGMDIQGNLVGLWVQNIAGGQTVMLHSANIESNGGVGIGVSGDTQGFIICKSKITGTSLKKLPVKDHGQIGGSQDLGDGLVWLEGSSVTVEGLTLSGNARASILIDGPAGGSLNDVTQSGGDAQKGILQQSFTGGMEQPTVGANVPALTTTSGEQFVTPVAPPSPSQVL